MATDDLLLTNPSHESCLPGSISIFHVVLHIEISRPCLTNLSVLVVWPLWTRVFPNELKVFCRWNNG